ncbi:hypothetical protein Tco_0299627 [Tanacetum coccineum]
MAQQVMHAAQLVPRYHTIGRCNNYAVLQSIPCSPECKIVGKILLDHPLSYALTATIDVHVVYLQQFWRTASKVTDTKDTIKFMLDTEKFTYTVDMFRDTLHLPVETPENPFVAPVNIQTIEAFMNNVGYQGMVDKVSAFYTKNLAQPWKTMFKVFNHCLTTRTSGHDQTKINVFQLFYVVINRTNVDYAALLWIDEDYHSIKDDIPLEYETVFMNVVVLMNQPQPAVSTQGTHMTTPRAYKTPTLTAASPRRKKRKQSVGETSSPKKSLKITIRQKHVDEGEKDKQFYDDTDDSDDRLEPGIHKENPEHVDDDDDEKVDEKKYDEIGSLEIRAEEMQTPIPTTPRSPRTILSSDKNITQELTDTVSPPTATTSKNPHFKRRISSKYSHLPVPDLVSQEFNAQEPKIIEELFKNYVHNNVIQVHPNTTTSTETNSSADLQQQLYLKMKRSLQDQANDPTLWEEWDAWVEETVIDEDEMIPEDETPELITKFHNVDKRVPTIFDRARMEATLNDMLSNQFKNVEENPNEPPRYLYNKDLFFLKNTNTEEKKYILSFHKIHAERFPEVDLEEKMNRWVRKEFKNFNKDARLSIQHWKDPWHKRVYKKNQRRVRNNPEDYFSNHMITKVFRITTDKPYGLDFMEQIIVIRENDKPDSFSEADFKYLNKNDIEDLYYLCRNKKVNYRGTKLMNSLITFTKSRVIWERVHDFQLGIESYQVKVNLTAPTLTFLGIETYEPYSIVDKPNTGLIYLNNKNEKRVMYLVEIVKFCDATLEKVLKEVKLKIFQSEPWKKPPLLGELDRDIMRAFEREITKRLKHREQMMRWESFVTGRPILPMMKRL